MNERMYQFCRQAQAYTEFHHQPGTYSADEWVRTFSQKFAELIVQECIDICLRNHINNIETISAGECAYDIQEHFGVE